MARLARLHSSPMAAAHVGLFSMLTIFGAAPDIAAGCVFVEKRKGEADRIRDKYPDRIPVSTSLPREIATLLAVHFG